MAHARKRHYRVAQKETEAQVCQREDDHRHAIIITYLIAIVLAAQIINLAIMIYKVSLGGHTNHE